jgi:hypothetical protein
MTKTCVTPKINDDERQQRRVHESRHPIRLVEEIGPIERLVLAARKRRKKARET